MRDPLKIFCRKLSLQVLGWRHILPRFACINHLTKKIFLLQSRQLWIKWTISIWGRRKLYNFKLFRIRGTSWDHLQTFWRPLKAHFIVFDYLNKSMKRTKLFLSKAASAQSVKWACTELKAPSFPLSKHLIQRLDYQNRGIWFCELKCYFPWDLFDRPCWTCASSQLLFPCQ